MEPFHILEYLEVTNTQMDFSILLITLNVPLRISKCTRRVHLPQVGIRYCFFIVEIFTITDASSEE